MKSYDIAAYSFRAAILCPTCARNWAREKLREQGFTEQDIGRIESETPIPYDCGLLAIESERVLNKLADILGVNLDDYYSFDSDNFPKVIFCDQIEEDEYCGTCNERIIG